MFWLVACFVVLLGGVQSGADVHMGDFNFDTSPNADSSDQLKQIITDDSLYIGIGDNYAVSTSALRQFNWASVNFNGNLYKIITPDCNEIVKNRNELGQDERRALDIATDTRSSHSSSQNVILFGSVHSRTSSIVGDVGTFDHGDGAVQQLGDNHRMISSPSLAAANVKWLSVDDDLVTIVFSNDTLQMRPRTCLDKSNQQQLLSVAETEMADTKAKWKADSAAQQTELKREMKNMRENIQAQAKDLRRQLRAQAAQLREQLRGGR